jgi:hypothetical protein
MSVIGEILDENTRIRESVRSLEGRISKQNASHATELAQRISEQNASHATELAKRDAIKERAEQLAKQLEFLRLKQGGPASQRYIPDEQDLLPFPGDIAPPPRAPEPEADDEEPEAASETKNKKGSGKKPRRRGRHRRRLPQSAGRVRSIGPGLSRNSVRGACGAGGVESGDGRVLCKGLKLRLSRAICNRAFLNSNVLIYPR